MAKHGFTYSGLEIFFGVVAFVVFLISLQGARAMLSGYEDNDKIPVIALIKSVTIPSDEFKFLLKAQDLGGRLHLSGNSATAEIPHASSPPLGHIDQFREDESGNLRIAGWAAASADQRGITAVGVVINGKMVSLNKRTVPRPDVNAAFKRTVRNAGFSILLKLPPNVSKCDVSVALLYSDLTYNWMKLPSRPGCAKSIFDSDR
jgi:hypothetical protein